MKQKMPFTNISNEPLANRLRPKTLEDYVGQSHLVAPGKILYQLINSDTLPSRFFGGLLVLVKQLSQESLPIKQKQTLSISVLLPVVSKIFETS